MLLCEQQQQKEAQAEQRRKRAALKVQNGGIGPRKLKTINIQNQLEALANKGQCRQIAEV